MKNYHLQMNYKLYYAAISFMILLMITGLFYDNEITFTFSFLLHSVLVTILTICLIIYPYFKNQIIRLLIITAGTAFFYMIFFIYPETVTSFILVCFNPAIAILFFNSTLFIFSAILNIISMIASFYYIIELDNEHYFSYITLDTMGNFVNFLVSQLILYVMYYLLNSRMKQQQTYYEQLQHSERLKTTGQLAAAVAHEIRNPLTTVKGFLQLYSEDNTISAQEIKQRFPLMISELNTAEEVITKFLTLSKPDTDHTLETVHVNVVLENIKELLKSYGFLHANAIELELEENCYICANKIEFKQLMINIIKNAIEASNVGDPVRIIARRKKRFVEIQIIDFGLGMSPSEVALLGTPFYSLKSNGTGLGLMICSNIVEKYQGSIHFQSAQNKGTTVTIRFPENTPHS